jgi:hypothetical protein
MGNRQNTTSVGVKKLSKEKLILVRSGVFYGLVIENKKTEANSINRGLTSTPTIIYYSGNTKCLIDYGNQTNADAEKTVSDFFTQIDPGTTIYIINGYYKDPTSEKTADVSGTYTFRKFANGVVSADVVSVNGLSASINRYDKLKFEQIPYVLSASLNTTDEQKTIVKNRFGVNTKNSFNYLGVKVGDYVKINTMTKPSKITEINIDSDGNEYIILEDLLESLDLTSTETVVTVYASTIDSFNYVPDVLEDKAIGVGACIEIQNNVIIACTNNNTITQCRLRSNIKNQINTEVTIGTFCRTPDTNLSAVQDTTATLAQATNAIANSLSTLSTSNGTVLRNGGVVKNNFFGRSF